ncbi:MAG: ABC transporter permease subunit [Alphaproteobacteria bacterium]|nr:ABC transporter permease subunit [Alphaproteobacteria bacterium]
MSERGARAWILTPVWLWLGTLVALPFGIVAKLSISEQALARPPYRPLLAWEEGGAVWQGTLGNYLMLATDPLYLRALASSVALAAGSTAIALLVGLGLAQAAIRAPLRWRALALAAIVLPFWTPSLIRIYAWIGILKPEGYLNAALRALGAIEQPLAIHGSWAAVTIGLVYTYLPFAVLPIYAALERQDPALAEAAADLGCPPWRAFWIVTVPAAWPGLAVGGLLMFCPAVGEFVVPELLGGPGTPMMGRVVWLEFFNNRDWPLASAAAMALVAILAAPFLIHQRLGARR